MSRGDLIAFSGHAFGFFGVFGGIGALEMGVLVSGLSGGVFSTSAFGFARR